MILAEEEISEIFNIEKIGELSKRINTSYPNIERDINLLKTTKVPKTWKDTGVNTYKTFIKDFWSLKESAREFMLDFKTGKYDRVKFKHIPFICHKILSIWSGNKGDIYHKLLELNSAIDNYNKRFPNNPLSHVDELIGIEIRPSVKTEEINYFPY